ncbi:hypothetical protein KR51_00031620 [Rubidibacter lacunae KORDI 51-2]|uniref:Thioredoxin domain-containing protein n=1 Tax=Rubidibacter lacunae KORDI 51-2 TaxID=582515 RepID=U5D6F0_9CHRO|nr:thylakoid membrane photosystem I accumulation factor [Rubidibacter lacunae]ERN40223.1 hypothetical protein KR51_00031620 [Rubidibacter lacunae KORDI 51-2]
MDFPHVLPHVLLPALARVRSLPWQTVRRLCYLTVTLAAIGLLLSGAPAIASVDDDRYEGNIFALYGGNGSLVPPHVTLAESLRAGKPALLVFYLDDSRDCKEYAVSVTRLQRFYGRAASFIAINVDSLQDGREFARTEAGYFYSGAVPQTVLIDGSGAVAFDGTGQVEFEAVDDAFREVFDLLPRTESVELKRRPVNEILYELTEE